MNNGITRRSLLAGTAGLAAGGALMTAGAAFASGDAAGGQGRTYHALLVAVTDYPQLPPRANLVGPNNDAALVRDFLLNHAPVGFEPENVTVLADGLDGATSPTREAIRAKMADLAARVAAGDFVYMHFSGHGAQQPAIDPAVEPDGLDEIFLPRDTGPWVDRAQGVPNAYIDKEIRDDLQAIRDKGAFIWAVFDCCHSGTMTRAASLLDEDVTDRKIDFADLGIPADEMAAAIAQGEGTTRGMGGEAPRQNALGFSGNSAPTGAESLVPGGMVAFFAAQTVETTPEMLLPRGADEATKLGLFTFTLFSRIAENPNITYRQLGQGVMQSYSADNRTRPTPLFEGDLDRVVFGADPGGDLVSQWPITIDGPSASIPAGMLHRLTAGARLAVVPSPASTLEDALGYLEVASATNLASRLRPSAPPASSDGGTQASAAAQIGLADIPAGAYARLVELSLQFQLTVAKPEAEGEFAAEIGMVNSVLDRIVAEQKVAVNLNLVGAHDPADLRLAVMSEMDVALLIEEAGLASAEASTSRASLSTEPRLWLLSPSGDLSLETGLRPPSVAIGGASEEEIAQALADNLVMIFRATNLSRLAAASDYRAEEVDVGFDILRIDTGEMEPLEPGKVPVLLPQDQIHMRARNSSSQAVDVNVLFVGSDYSISHMYAERIHGGGEITLPLLAITDSSFGVERMVVVLTEGLPLTPVEDLAFLEQAGVRQATRSAAGSSGGFDDLLQDLAAAPATRSAARIGQSSGKKGAVLIYPMETMPRS